MTTGSTPALLERLERIERIARNELEDRVLTELAQEALADLEQLAERCATALAHCGVPDDGSHPYSDLLLELRRVARR